MSPFRENVILPQKHPHEVGVMEAPGTYKVDDPTGWFTFPRNGVDINIQSRDVGPLHEVRRELPVVAADGASTGHFFLSSLLSIQGFVLIGVSCLAPAK